MLTESAYMTGLAVYAFTALLLLFLGNLWLLRGWSAGPRLIVTLPLAMLLLLPAYASPVDDTLAPAVVAAALGWLRDGAEGAEHALRPLLLFTGASLLFAAVLWLLLALWQRRAAAQPEQGAAS